MSLRDPNHLHLNRYARCRRTALIGFAIWCVFLPVFAGLVYQVSTSDAYNRSPIWATLLLFTIVSQIAVSIWAGFNLALAKSQPGILAFLGIIGPIGQLGLFIILFTLPDKHSQNAAVNRAQKPRQNKESTLERIVRFRRNAFVANLGGLAGIALGIFFIIFRVGIFASHEYEYALGMALFVIGYFSIITGCGWWLKAKEWNEGLVLIGLAPLGILFIPFVRLLLLTAPLLLPAAMTLMPLILIVVIFVLPDKSAWAHRPRAHFPIPRPAPLENPKND